MCRLKAGGPDPESADEVMLTRRRVSRIYYHKKFFDYPVRMNANTIRNMGLVTTLEAGMQLSGGDGAQIARGFAGELLHQPLRQEALLHVL